MLNENIIEMRSISKVFGSLRANDGVDLTVRKGEVHAILGENGAGKSTLMNVLTGIYKPDSGTIHIDGDKAVFRTPQDAIKAGIGMIYQHFKLVDALTAWENICAGPSGAALIRPAELKKAISELSERTSLCVDLDKKIRDMGVGEKQTVEILKVLYRGADILILDEPTTVLTPLETELLFDIIRKMRDDGKTTIIITHKLSEVMAISDRVTVLQKGQVVDTVDTAGTSQKKLAEMMVGRDLEMDAVRTSSDPGPVILDVRHLSARDTVSLRTLSDISFSLHSGEILGIAGVSGSGQKQLCQSLMGMLPKEGGTVELKGRDISSMSTRDIVAGNLISMGFIPEDRLGMGLAAGMDLVDNVMLKNYRESRGPLLDRKSAVKKTEKLVETLNIMHPGLSKPIRTMSGGNLQKVLIGREITGEPEVLIAAYPVRGLDLGVTAKVIELLNEQKKRGAGVILIAEDLDFLLDVSDRIMVMFCGSISGTVDTADATKEELGLMMSSETGACSDD